MASLTLLGIEYQCEGCGESDLVDLHLYFGDELMAKVQVPCNGQETSLLDPTTGNYPEKEFDSNQDQPIDVLINGDSAYQCQSEYVRAVDYTFGESQLSCKPCSGCSLCIRYRVDTNLIQLLVDYSLEVVTITFLAIRSFVRLILTFPKRLFWRKKGSERE
ncbi:MAG: hypothetical protein HC866_06595 [Leptolyngbyaceae cyanobacterium RU_5_1]|nr:hypothetical protein [Leptolyngbyaceae cyanobacterium RU_5_1]